MRPINLRTDLAALADLIELVFANSMDSGGYAALREMRYLSRIGPGLHLLSRMNDLTAGINMGYVWVVDGRLVGNVSVYPAHWPSDLGSAWIIANVGVHPDYQRRGIARELMHASMAMIRRRGGTAAILQVDADNTPAHHLYRTLGFVNERSWDTWRRPGTNRIPEPISDSSVLIRRRRRHEWREEMELAQRLRPQQQGGLGWLRPLHISQFRKSLWSQMLDWVNLRGMERLVIRSNTENRLAASAWVESGMGKTQITLLVDPRFHGIYDNMLLNNIVRRFSRGPIVIEHPADERITAEVLERYRFLQQRRVTHMRWDAR